MIPLEPITALVGLGVGAYVRIKEQQSKTLQVAIQRDQQAIEDTQNARKHSVDKPGIQWTKRVLALTLVGTWSALHLGVSVPDLLGLDSTVIVGYTEIVPRFLFFGEKEAVKWVTVEGATLTPAFSHMVALVCGYYFGSGGSRQRKL